MEINVWQTLNWFNKLWISAAAKRSSPVTTCPATSDLCRSTFGWWTGGNLFSWKQTLFPLCLCRTVFQLQYFSRIVHCVCCKHPFQKKVQGKDLGQDRIVSPGSSDCWGRSGSQSLRVGGIWWQQQGYGGQINLWSLRFSGQNQVLPSPSQC